MTFSPNPPNTPSISSSSVNYWLTFPSSFVEIFTCTLVFSSSGDLISTGCTALVGTSVMKHQVKVLVAGVPCSSLTSTEARRHR